MSHVRSLTVEPVRVSPAEAVVVVRVEVEPAADGVEVRGRLVGPRREGVSTVEVAYPLRPEPDGDDGLSLRAVIPEPNLWSADAPFRYDGRLEVWAGGRRAEVREFTVELRTKR
jgi:hypothetical protein